MFVTVTAAVKVFVSETITGMVEVAVKMTMTTTVNLSGL